jgi:molybdate transport system substrate-binding protein
VTSVSDEPNVKAVISKVQLGEVDAGIVYVTDTRDAGAAVGAVAIPDEQNVSATYPVVLMTAGHGRAAGDAFVVFLLSAEGQRILAAHGFAKP